MLRDGQALQFLWLQKFDSLNSLVNFHTSNSVCGDEQIYLRQPERVRLRNTHALSPTQVTYQLSIPWEVHFLK